MKKNLKYLLLFGVTALIFEACSNVDKIGPELDGIFSKVEIAESLAVSDNTPNFATGERAAFSAKFIKDTYWVLTLTGGTSGAIKTYSGTSKEINPSKVIWSGTADDIPFFASSEVVTAKVKFPYSPDDSMSVALNIPASGARNLNEGGIVISDFENSPFNSNDAEVGPGGGYGVGITPHLPINNKYGTISSSAIPTKGTFAGYYGLPAVPGGYKLFADPSKVYFNMLVYGTGDKLTARISLLENGVVARYTEITPNWLGWKLISVRYTDFLPSTPEDEIIMNPHKITKVTILLFTNEEVPSKVISFPIDKMIFTHYKPFQP